MQAVLQFNDFFYNILRYREYLKQSVARDLRKRYKRSVLGYCWSMLNPLFMMIILAVVFSKLMRGHIEDYAVFLFSGMLPWAYFNGTVRGCLDTIRANARIMDQVTVPKYIFALSTAFSNLVDFLLSVIPLLLVTIVIGRDVPPTILFIPMMLIPLFFFSVGIALIFAVSNVFFEDTQHLVGVLLQALYFLCPILYKKEMLPHWLGPWVSLNPMFGMIESFRELFYYGTIPSFELYATHLLSSTLILFIGLYVFSKADKKFIYFI